MAAPTMDQRQGMTPPASKGDFVPRFETPKTEVVKPRVMETPKSVIRTPQQSMNRGLAWTAGIAIVLAAVSLFIAVKANNASASAMSGLADKADKSEIARAVAAQSAPSSTAGNTPHGYNNGSGTNNGSNMNNGQNANSQGGSGNNQDNTSSSESQ